jgi:hypothetical protein
MASVPCARYPRYRLPLAHLSQEKINLSKSCGDAAEYYFNSEYKPIRPEWSYTSHYNQERSQCLIMIDAGGSENIRDALDRSNVALRWMDNSPGKHMVRIFNSDTDISARGDSGSMD